MSDISKKIFSIEPDVADVIKQIEPIEDKVKIPNSPITRADDPVPDFVRRERINSPLDQQTSDGPKTGWITWIGIIASLIWLAAVCAYFFGILKLHTGTDAFTVTAFILTAFLPVIFIAAFCMVWARLLRMNYQAQTLGNIAQRLLRADETAMDNTKRLADGIRAEMASVDARLAETIERFSTLRVNLSSEKRAIDETATALTERSEDVGRNLTIQRQALESISGTFDSKMETLSAIIEKQSQSLGQVTEQAHTKITQSNETLEATIANLSGAGTELTGKLSEVTKTVSGSSGNLTKLNQDLTELIARLQEEQTKLQSEMSAQVKEISDVTDAAAESSQLLITSLRSGQESVAALNTASLDANETLTKQFEDMGDKIAKAQVKANEISEKAAGRVQDNLANTRRDLAKLETDMLALQAKLRNAKADSENLDLGLKSNTPQTDAGVGRLRLKPLDTDFPPVEPPRLRTERLSETESALTPELFEPLAEVGQPDEPLNLGADMRIETPDDALTSYEPDILRRPAPETKGFGRADPKSKAGWRWRDMLGGLERPAREDAADIVTAMGSAAPLTAPDLSINGSEIVAALCQMDLAPSAIVDEGTIIEASKIYMQSGGPAMQSHIAARLASPVEHLKAQLSANRSLAQDFQRFTADYDAQLSLLPRDPALLRAELGTAQGRAFLICAGAFKG